ncbi:MAG: GspMb/PilO family protein [Pseudomonadota bacterium]
MTAKFRKTYLILVAVSLLAVAVGGIFALVYDDHRSSITKYIWAAERQIRADISLISASPQRDPEINPVSERLIIRETRIQLALATLQEIVRDAVEDHGGVVASMNGGDPIVEVWGATIRLSARFEAPHGSIIDILDALETGNPAVLATEASFSSRTSPRQGDAERTFVIADVDFSAFTSARPAEQ